MDTRTRLAMIARGEKPPPRVSKRLPSAEARNEAFALIEECARTGQRAPFNDQVKGGSNTFRALADKGLIRIEVYALNWRVVEIRKGALAGQRTMEPPSGGRPYRIIGPA